MRTSEKKFLFHSRFKAGTHGAFGDCACGITNYDTANNWDEDHAETIERVDEGPQAQFQDNAIEFINIDNNLFVIGCKCKTDEILFSMLNEHRDDVVRWLRDTQEQNL